DEMNDLVDQVPVGLVNADDTRVEDRHVRRYIPPGAIEHRELVIVQRAGKSRGWRSITHIHHGASGTDTVEHPVRVTEEVSIGIAVQKRAAVLLHHLAYRNSLRPKLVVERTAPLCYRLLRRQLDGDRQIYERGRLVGDDDETTVVLVPAKRMTRGQHGVNQLVGVVSTASEVEIHHRLHRGFSHCRMLYVKNSRCVSGSFTKMLRILKIIEVDDVIG